MDLSTVIVKHWEMKLIESNIEILPQESGLEGIYKQIEIAARTCYKSESFIKEGSAEKMVNALIQRGHGTPLEHGTIYLHRCFPNHSEEVIAFQQRYARNKYSKIKCELIKEEIHIYVSSNYRVLVENGWLEDLQYLCEPTEYHEKRITIRMTCSRAVTHEVVRHRENMSYCQESQRYVNYNLDKFGNEITYIIPEWIYDVQSEEASYKHRDYLMDLKGEELIDELAKINESVCV